jgi:Phage integrase, N-terminal SAM-like domain
VRHSCDPRHSVTIWFALKCRALHGARVNQLASPTKSTARLRTAHPVPALMAVAGDRASLRFLGFFAANIRNPRTRRAYGRAVAEFLAWCDDQGVPSASAVQPLHVAAWIELQQQESAAPTVKSRLAAIRHLFDWLVTGQVVPVSSTASSVRGPSHVVRADKTPVLAPEEARALIDAIEITTHAGLRIVSDNWARHRIVDAHSPEVCPGRFFSNLLMEIRAGIAASTPRCKQVYILPTQELQLFRQRVNDRFECFTIQFSGQRRHQTDLGKFPRNGKHNADGPGDRQPHRAAGSRQYGRLLHIHKADDKLGDEEHERHRERHPHHRPIVLQKALQRAAERLAVDPTTSAEPGRRHEVAQNPLQVTHPIFPMRLNNSMRPAP